MINFSTILCPVDIYLNVTTDEALRYALTFARTYQAKLLVYYCAHVVDTSRTPTFPATREQMTELVARSIELYVPAEERSTLDVESLVVAGDDVGETIIREARNRNADLIIMGSRRRPLRAALLGSSAEAVSRNAPCPVLVTHQPEGAWAGMPKTEITVNRLLVGYDFSESSELALKYGISLAQNYQAELHLLHVLPRLEEAELEISWDEAAAEGAYHKAARRLQEAVPPEVHLWCKRVVHTVRWGKPYDEILKCAQSSNVDLICMGAQGAGFRASALFGSNTDRVLRQSPSPVLVAR